MHIHVISVFQAKSILNVQCNRIVDIPQCPRVVVTHSDCEDCFLWNFNRQILQTRPGKVCSMHSALNFLSMHISKKYECMKLWGVLWHSDVLGFELYTFIILTSNDCDATTT
jgi:hypothetical protein